MQTRLRSRLGLTALDELPDPVPIVSSPHISTTRTTISLRRRTPSILGDGSGQQESSVQSDNTWAASTHKGEPPMFPAAPVAAPRRFVLLRPHATSIRTGGLGDSDNAVLNPRLAWREVARSCSETLPNFRVLRERREIAQRGLRDAILHAQSRARHEQRLRMLLADDEGAFRNDLLQELREKRVSLRTSVTEAPSVGSTRFGRHAPQLSPEEVEERAALRLLEVVDALDAHLEAFHKAQSAKVEESASAAERHLQQLAFDGLVVRGSATDLVRPVGPVQKASSKRHPPLRGVVGATFQTASTFHFTLDYVHRALQATQAFAKLMPFQKDGLVFLLETMLIHKLNCLLADEMGLGKTISSIALLSSVVQMRKFWCEAHPITAHDDFRESRCPLRPLSSSCSRRAKRVRDEGDDDDAASDDDDDDYEGKSQSRRWSAASTSNNSTRSLPLLVPTKKLPPLVLPDHVMRPMLVLGPLSTLPNWGREFENFEPGVFDVFIINGSAAEREMLLHSFLARVYQLSFGASVAIRTPQRRKGRRNATDAAAHDVMLSSPTLWTQAASGPMDSDDAPRVPVLLLPHDFFSRKLDHIGLQLLHHVPWQMVVIDEAQRIKNSDSKLYRVLSEELRFGQQRLALTGTPLQNNVMELFALLEFLLPERFNRKDEATVKLMRLLNDVLAECSSLAVTTQTGSSTGDARGGMTFSSEALQMLLCRRMHTFLQPMMLRREKAFVLDQLPSKDENVIVCPEMALQTIFLNALDVKRQRKTLSGHYSLGVRKVLMHPYLMLHSFYMDERMVYTSGKFFVLDVVLRFLLRFRHKVLIFSNWTKVLDVVESLCILREIPCVRLEGRTAVELREKHINRFTAANDETEEQTSEAPAPGEHPCNPTSGSVSGDIASTASVDCFLISKIAGGVGLNLQAADTVILLDVDYNPQRDAQALARAYRVGQKKHVKVLRFVLQHPVEERMLQVAAEKQHLEGALVHAGRYDLTSTGADRDASVQHVFESMRQRSLSAQLQGVDGTAASAADIVNEQLMASLPRSIEETETLCEMLHAHWFAMSQFEAAERASGMELDPEEAAWHALASATS